MFSCKHNAPSWRLKVYLLGLVPLAFLILPSLFFPYVFHDSAQTFSSQGCAPNPFIFITGRPLSFWVLCGMNEVLPNPAYLWIFRVAGWLLLAFVTLIFYALLSSPAEDDISSDRHIDTINFITASFLTCLPGSLLQVLHYQALPLLIAVLAALIGAVLIVKHFASETWDKPRLKAIGTICACLVLFLWTLFTYQSSLQIVFSTIVCLLFFSKYDFRTILRIGAALFAMFIFSCVVYYVLHKYFMSYEYFWGDGWPTNTATEERDVTISAANILRLFKIETYNFVITNLLPEAAGLGLVSPVPHPFAIGVAVIVLFLVASVLRARELSGTNNTSAAILAGVLFAISTMLLLCADFPLLLVSEAASYFEFTRVNWFQSAVILLIFMYIIRSVTFNMGSFKPHATVFVACAFLFTIGVEQQFILAARIIPNYREYRFVKHILSHFASKKTKLAIVISAEPDAISSHLGPVRADEFNQVTSYYDDDVISLVQLIARARGLDIPEYRHLKWGTPKLDELICDGRNRIARGEWVVVDFRKLWPNLNHRIPSSNDGSCAPLKEGNLDIGARLHIDKMKPGIRYPIAVVGDKGEADIFGGFVEHGKLNVFVDRWGRPLLHLFSTPINSSSVDIEIRLNYLTDMIQIVVDKRVDFNGYVDELRSYFNRKVVIGKNTIGASTVIAGEHADVVSTMRAP